MIGTVRKRNEDRLDLKVGFENQIAIPAPHPPSAAGREHASKLGCSLLPGRPTLVCQAKLRTVTETADV